MTHDEQTVERVAKAMSEVSNYPADMRPLARAALDAMRLTESEVATAVYRHFTTPSREQIAEAVLYTMYPEYTDTWAERELYVQDRYRRVADAILALFEQNGAEHE